jgi:hypothetical protein
MSQKIHPGLIKADGPDALKFLRGDGTWQTVSAGGGAWGGITGTLSDQTDLQSALGTKAPLASPTFTGTVALPAAVTMNGTNPTFSTQRTNAATPLFTFAGTGSTGTPASLTLSSSLTYAYAGTTYLTVSTTGISTPGTLAGSNLSGTNTGDETSGTITTKLGYTPTSVTGLTGTQSVSAFKTGLSLVKGDVGLSNVDNTADSAKPVSSAQQTALNLKADLTGATFTGFTVVQVAGTPLRLNDTASGTSKLRLQNNGTDVGFIGANATGVTLQTSTGTVILQTATTGVSVTGTLGATGAVTGSNLSGTNTGDETYSTITSKLAGGSGGGTTNFLRADGTFAAPPGGAAWGGITGTLSSQTDLQNALNAKAPLASPAFTGIITGSRADFNGATGGIVNLHYNGAVHGSVFADTLGVTFGSGSARVSVESHTANLEAYTGAVRIVGETGIDLQYSYSTKLAITATGATVTGTLSATGTVVTAASTTSAASLRVPHGSAPTSPVNGDVWTTTAGMYARINGTSVGPFGAGGGGTPSGSDTQIQFNNAGSFGASADFTWNNTSKTLTLGGTDPDLVMGGITNEPPTPPAGSLVWYSKNISGRMVPKVKGPSGLDYPLQATFWQNNIVMWNPNNATGGVWLGTVGSGAGTYSGVLPTTTNIYTSMKRSRWANVATTLNQVLGQRNTEAMYARGSIANQGGFFFFARCGMDAWTNGGRFFAGMHSGTTVISADPSALNNTMGFCVDAADNGAISFLTRGTVATKASTGFTFASNSGFDLYIFCAPNDTKVGWRIRDINTGTEASGTATTNLPLNTTMLTAGVLASNASLTPVTAVQLGVNRIYVETDY